MMNIIDSNSNLAIDISDNDFDLDSEGKYNKTEKELLKFTF
jgi:hypothetical protein